MPRARVLQPGQHAIHLPDLLADAAARGRMKLLVLPKPGPALCWYRHGDLLLVREAFQPSPHDDAVVFRADGHKGYPGQRWRPCYPGQARTWLRVIAATSKPVSKMTNEEALDCGHRYAQPGGPIVGAQLCWNEQFDPSHRPKFKGVRYDWWTTTAVFYTVKKVAINVPV